MTSPTDSTQTLPGERLPESANETMHNKNNRGDYEEPGSSVLWVDWEGPDDLQNPKNWAFRKKWMATTIVSLFTFISPVSSSMVAPATSQVVEEFAVTSSALQAMVTSVFVLGYALGPLILGPMSELWGRSRVLQTSNLFYLAWNTACGFAQNKEQLIAFRFLSGLGGSAPLAIGGGVLGDIWSVEERGKASAIYSLAPLLGPVIGPVCGGWIAERSTWRWVFWSTSIVDVMIQAAGLIFLKESFAPYLLEQKAKSIRATMDLENGPVKEVRSVFESKGSRHWKDIFGRALTRPFALFVHEPIMQLLGLYMALIYGIFYLFLTTIPAIFARIYHQDVGISGLNYIALGIGLTGASQINARYMDRIYIWLRENRGNGVDEPEFRLPSMVPGTIAMPIGLLITGWAAQSHVHWAVTDFGIILVGGGMILNFQAIQVYILDTFTLHAASALAAASFLRSLAGFGFPLFAPAMYEKLGYGQGDTILACVSIALGCPAPFIFWFYGKKIRSMSKYARKPQNQQGQAQPKKEAPAAVQPGNSERPSNETEKASPDRAASDIVIQHRPSDAEKSSLPPPNNA